MVWFVDSMLVWSIFVIQQRDDTNFIRLIAESKIFIHV